MAMAKAISLGVRPVQSADLCFPVNGIVEYLPQDLLGRAVQAFNLRGMQEKLLPHAKLPDPLDVLTVGSVVSGGGGPLTGGGILGGLGKPVNDGPEQIEADLARVMLSRLRAQDVATELTQALSWYGMKHSADQADDAVKQRVALLGKSTQDSNSLLGLLNNLSTVLKNRYDKIAHLYSEIGPSEVTDPTSISSTESTTTGGQTFTTKSETNTTYFGREYQVPPAENKARYLRSEISLRQERLAAFRLVRLNSNENILFEKAMTAAEIRKIQLAYINTFLVAPFDGVITAVFRNVGDFVTTGQPVLRLENDKDVYVLGVIKCRSLVRIGHTAKVTTTLFGEPGAPTVEIQGTVCAVRGHESADEQWSVMFRCNNQGPSGRILPLNYNFDFDNTEIEIDAI